MAITECDRIPPALRRGAAAQYGGQQLLTGHQAEVYADHFIAQHIADMTYSQLATESMAQPNNIKLAALVNLLWAERRRRGTPKGSRALTCFWEAVLGLQWFRGRTPPDTLARDHGISRATAYRYRDEVIEVLAEQAPDLYQALERAKGDGFAHVILDGKIIPCDRRKEPAVSVKGQVIDLWYSGKAHCHGGSIQAVLAPDGFPL
jgi:hypothetical protein